jgi:outer membrane lipase/esterase
MKIMMLAAGAIALATSVSAVPVDLSQTYSSFVAFGDSLTDDGKLAGSPFAPGLPSVGGRFSNGITFAEDVAQDFSYSLNLAIGGATARSDNESPLPPAFGTFQGQVATFSGLASNPAGRAALGDRPLFSILFGANDILQNIGLPSDFDIVPQIGALAANAIEAGIRAINAVSSDFKDFAVMNLPDISKTPLFQNPAFGTGALRPLAALETAGFNAQLALNMASLRNDGFNIVEFDLNSLFEQYLGEASLLGVDTVNPCSFDLSIPGPEGTCVFSPGSPDNTDIALADNFFFIDGIHPNRNVQAAFADDFRAGAAPAPIPLPAALPLLVVGLGVFGFVRRRQMT